MNYQFLNQSFKLSNTVIAGRTGSGKTYSAH